MSEFRIADGLNINVESLASEGKRWVISGITGTGKSNTMKVLARAMILAGWTVAIIDPMNNFRALRDSGLPVIVAGSRKSADVPITNTAALAGFSFRERVSVVLDTGSVAPKHSMELVGQFLERLWEMVQSQDEDGPFTPYALFIDEARMYIPQTGKVPVTDLLNDMSTRGRQLHLAMVIASQRLTSIQKETVLMAHVRITHKIANIDVDSFAAEFGMEKKATKKMMRTFDKGEAVVIADPDIADMGEDDYIVCRIDEFGGSATPAAQRATTAVRQINPDMLAALKASMQEPPDAVQPDVLGEARSREAELRDLRRQILQLETDLKQARNAPLRQVEVPVLKDEHVEQLRKTGEEAIALGQNLIGMGQEMLLTIGRTPFTRGVQHSLRTPSAAPQRPLASTGTAKKSFETQEPVKAGARRMLKAMAQRYPRRFDRDELAVLSNFNADGGGFSTYLSTLRTRGFLDETTDGYTVTPAVLEWVADDPTMPETPEALIEMWKPKLKGKTKAMLEALASIYPHAMTRQDLAVTVEMEVNGGGFSTYLSILRSNNLILVEGAKVRAADILFVDQMVTS